MIIKICGNTTKAGVNAAVAAGATHLGFVMSPSRRQVTASQVRAMTVDVPATVTKVGVFVDEPIDFVRATVAAAGLDMAQLHGDEDMGYIRQLQGIPVIKAVKSDADFVKFDATVLMLLDAPHGGSGQTFDWAAVDPSRLTRPYLVAGGLTADNVAAAVEAFPTAAGVDVSSGVEADGIKDATKIRAFVRRAQEAKFRQILSRNTTLMAIIKAVAALGLPDCWLSAGALYQTIWNYEDGRPLMTGIADVDVVYYDATNRAVSRDEALEVLLSQQFPDMTFDVHNEANMHHWRGQARQPYSSVANAMTRWIATVHAVGIRLSDDNPQKLEILSPFGLTDIFHRTIRPIYHADNSRDAYEAKAGKWQARFGGLTVLPWRDEMAVTPL